ncbi:MAG: NUDIX hydrolase [Microgenomates group bacterium]
MTEPKFRYEKINVIKIIVENSEGKILLIQEPETNDWMPLHWGLPGGKPLAGESLLEASKRKLKEELGQNMEPEGIWGIKELLLTERTVLVFIAVARIQEGIELSGESKTYKWVTEEDIESMDISEHTEYYNKELLIDFFTGNKKLIPFTKIKSYKFYELENVLDFKRWWESGKKDIEKT